MLGVRIQAALTGVGNWPLGAALSFLMLAAFVLCYALTPARLRLAQARPDPVRGVSATQRSPVTFAVTLAALVFLFVPLVIVVLFSFHTTGALSFPFTGLLAAVVPGGRSAPYEFREAL